MTRAEKHKKYMREIWYPKNKAKHIAMVSKSKNKRRKKLSEKVRKLKKIKDGVYTLR